MNSKRVLFLSALLAVAVVVLGVFVWLRVGAYVKGGDLAETARHLPKDASAVLAGKGFLDLALELRREAPQAPLANSQFRERFEALFGFDPSDLNQWRTLGLDFGQPWVVATLGTSPAQLRLLLLLPITDEDDAQKTLTTLLSHPDAQAPQVTREEVTLEGGHKAWVLEVQGPRGEVTPAAYTFRDGHLIGLAGMSSRFEPQSALQAYLARDPKESLASSADFSAALQTVGDDWHVFAFADDALYRPLLAIPTGDAQALHGVAGRGLAVTLRYGRSDAAMTLALLNAQDAPVSTLWTGGEDRLGHLLPGPVLAAGRLGVDPKTVAALWADSLRRASPLEVDFEKDVLAHLGDSVGFALYEGADEARPFDAVVWAQAKDEEALAASVARVAEGMVVAKHEGQRWWKNRGVSAGLAQGHLVLASSEALQARVAERLANGGKGEPFTLAFPAPAREALASGPPVFAYADLERSRPVLEQRPGARRGADERALLDELRWASVRVDDQDGVHGGVWKARLRLVTREGGVARVLLRGGQ